MATYLQNLITSRDQLAETLAAESANPRPNYKVEGREFTWNDYRTSLVRQIAALNKMIIAGSGATEIRTIGLG